MVELIDDNPASLITSGRVSLRGKPPEENPHDPRCRLALQRICGTCVHYPGPLRPEPGQGDHAPCAYFGHPARRLARAWSCHRWERKGGGNV